MNGLLQELLGLAEVEHIRRELESGCPSAVMTGLSPVHRVHLDYILSADAFVQFLIFQV